MSNLMAPGPPVKKPPTPPTHAEIAAVAYRIFLERQQERANNDWEDAEAELRGETETR